MKEETRTLLIKAERAIRAAEALRLRGDADFYQGCGRYGQDSKSFSIWCRGRGSNPHARCQAQDFKVFTPASRKLLSCL